MNRVREIVADRDGDECARCGRYLWKRSVHHRLPRGMGGSNSVIGINRTERASNLVTLCGTGTTGCHGWIESHRALAYASGWLVHRDSDPATVPLIDVIGRTFLLDDGGNKTMIGVSDE